ncbi:uncharacterized protein LOC118263408 isoform X3 [Spodoptera frugiperda]|uniref:Uncharacterized protein LOC118263408 isoform X3 n=1 Tax=Spodoptera frugiperda TaxID=7108 RepID=A0A9R0F3E8_SPOFR|nr:uncharacterized protein LOC118263408 isoform X3 [Spodoptera frugiperda]
MPICEKRNVTYFLRLRDEKPRRDNKPLLNLLLGTVDEKPAEPLSTQELNEKLNEISLQSKAAIEDLRNQSIKIVDNARAETDMVIENARYSFNMFSHSLEEMENRPPELSKEEPPTEETFEEVVEKYFGSRNVIDFLS